VSGARNAVPVSAPVGCADCAALAFCPVLLLIDTGEWSGAKFGALLFGHCSLHRFDLILDSHKFIAVGLTGCSSLNVLDEGAAPTYELVAQY
jgi:hypothetical protein